jgi:hypothetical protein
LIAAMRNKLFVALIGLFCAGCMSDSQLMELHKAELEKRKTARDDARSNIAKVQAAVTKADLEKCRNILRKKTDFRVDGPLRPDTKYTCATKHGTGWFDAGRVRAAYVTWATRADASTRTIFKKMAYCVFEIEGGKVVNVSGKIHGEWRSVRDVCHSI